MRSLAGWRRSTTVPPTSRPTSPCRAARVPQPLRGAQRHHVRSQRDVLRHGRGDAGRLRGLRPRPGARSPSFNLQIPSLDDPSLAPEGMHAASSFAFYLPVDSGPRVAEPPARRDGRADRGQDHRGGAELPGPDRPPAQLPGLHLRADVRLHRRRLHPRPAPARVHGPVPARSRGWPDNPVPVEGLYLCGAGCHGGPGVTFIPGYNCGYDVLEATGARL